MKQLDHSTTNFSEKKFPIVLVTDSLVSPANIGSLFRLADAFNIEKIIFCGSEPDLKSNRLKRTARATIESVAYEEGQDILSVVHSLRLDDYKVLALEISQDSVPLHSFDFSQLPKLALIVGNERNGIHEEVLHLADKRIHIEMFGKNSSMNVAQAAGIALFEITKSLQSI